MSSTAPVADVRAISRAAAPISQAGELRSSRIESLRAVAALGVLVGHTFAIARAYHGTYNGLRNQLISGGLLAVFLFFTLSGYLLYWPFASHAFGEGIRIDLVRYVRNRALRILPLYYVVLAVLLAFDPFNAHRSDWWRFALFIESYAPRTVERLDSAMWSLSVEVQFYILLPFLAAAIAWLARRSAPRAIAIVLILAAASFALRLRDVILPAGTTFSALSGPLSLPTLFYFFATGMLIALLRASWQRRPPSRPRGVFASPDAWILLAVALWCLAAVDPKREPLIAASCFLIVAGCVLAPAPGVLVKVLDWRPLAAVGLASYSLYLWHVPLLVLLSGARFVFPPGELGRDLSPPQSFGLLLLTAVPVCLAAAFGSYALIEVPFLRLRRRWFPR